MKALLEILRTRNRVLLLALFVPLSGCTTLTSVSERSGPTFGSALKSGNSSTTLVLKNPKGEAASAYRLTGRIQDDRARLDALLSVASLTFAGANSTEPETDERKIYNAACADAAVIAHRIAEKRGSSTQTLRLNGRNFERVEIADRDAQNFLLHETVKAADLIKVKRLDKEVKVKGLGGTLVAYSSKASNLHSNDLNVLREGRALALTATITFPREKGARIEIHDPGREDEIIIAGKRRKLAADFSTPVGMLGSKTAKGDAGLRALFKPLKNEELRGLGFIAPYDDSKIPVVFIHGLMSLPRVWLDVYLDMMKDERLRENYQFWYYRYPTGYGIGLNSYEFRKSFEKAMDQYDPNRTNRSLNQSVLIGHSMGGLLTSISIRSSGNRVWNQIADRPASQLGLDSAEQERLRSVAFFEPIPQVSRAVFVATPHRGSEIASGFGGKLGISLIRIPGSILGMAETITPGNLAGLSSLGMEAVSQKITSIDHLKPDAWELETLQQLPISPRVTTHSIIGMVKEAPLEESTDGVVPYWSSQIDGVDSELIVESDHGVPENEEAVAEIERILHLHLDRLGR